MFILYAFEVEPHKYFVYKIILHKQINAKVKERSALPSKNQWLERRRQKAEQQFSVRKKAKLKARHLCFASIKTTHKERKKKISILFRKKRCSSPDKTRR
jgi:hypothetical protein